MSKPTVNIHNRLMGHDIVGCLLICIVCSALTVANAKHLSLEEVEALERKCLSAEEPIFAEYRNRAIAECKEMAKKNRGDPEACTQHFSDIQPARKMLPGAGKFRIDPPLPICIEADEARRHFRIYP